MYEPNINKDVKGELKDKAIEEFEAGMEAVNEDGSVDIGRSRKLKNLSDVDIMALKKTGRYV